MIQFVIAVVVFSPSTLVCYMLDLSLCDILVPLDMNLDEFSGCLYVKIGILSINLEFLSIVNELLKRALCVLNDSLLRYYPVFGPQISIFSFVQHQTKPNQFLLRVLYL